MNKQVTPKLRANKTPKSLVKVVVSDDTGKWVTPVAAANFEIDAQATFPQIIFEIETTQPGPYKWSWIITWNAKVSGLRESAKRGPLLKIFTEKGSFESSEKKWAAKLGKVVGGRLAVVVSAGSEKFKRSVSIKGSNPTASGVKALLSTLPDSDGFDKLLEQETHFKHFIVADGQPVVAFDKGYGLTQMTNPAPSFEQVWNWKENVKAGVGLYQQKQALAKAHLSQQGRTYTSEQLRLETWTRWNGGSYFVWDSAGKTWIRNDNLLCDTETGNIGWDMTVAENKGKTETELHSRDADSYSNPKKNKTAENKWRYTGLCYADHVNAQ
jgi:hypothetical protein